MADQGFLIAAGGSPRKIYRRPAPAAITICFLVLVCVSLSTLRADDTTTRPAAHIDHKGLVKLGWQLACQGSTFHDRDPMQMVELLHSLGVHHIELSPTQAQAVDPDALAAKLKSVHMDIVSYGVVELSNDPQQSRKTFDLAKTLKARNIVASPSPDSLEMLDALANEYRINLAIVNSAKPGPNWDCDALAAALHGRSNRIGVCADIANFRRSRLDPAQCLAKLGWHVIECRLSADDADMNNALSWFKAQKFKGIFAIESDAGNREERVNNFIALLNAFSDQVTRLASANQ